MGTIPLRIKRLFWDVDREEVEVKAHRFYIIRRIIDYGNLEDVQWMKETYSPEEIIEVVRKSRGLTRKSACFWAAYFNIAKEEIECLKEPYQRVPGPF